MVIARSWSDAALARLAADTEQTDANRRVKAGEREFFNIAVENAFLKDVRLNERTQRIGLTKKTLQLVGV
jgi:hypothetical protein